jgi:hypothetical protein
MISCRFSLERRRSRGWQPLKNWQMRQAEWRKSRATTGWMRRRATTGDVTGRLRFSEQKHAQELGVFGDSTMKQMCFKRALNHQRSSKL